MTLSNDCCFSGASWNRAGVLLYGTPDGILRSDAGGGNLALVTKTDPGRNETGHASPLWLPDQQHFLYLRASRDDEKTGIFVGSIDSKPEQQDLKPLLATIHSIQYSPGPKGRGELLFVRDGFLMAQAFDEKHLRLECKPVQIASEVDTIGPEAEFSLSAGNVLVYRTGGAGLERRLTWFDRQGHVLGTAGEPGPYRTLKISPDGKRITVARNGDIFVVNGDSGTVSRLTSSPGSQAQPVWSPDGSRVVYQRFRGPRGIYARNADGGGQEELIHALDERFAQANLTQWTLDGRWILTFAASPDTKEDVWAIPAGRADEPVRVVQTNFVDMGGYVSPNGKWIAYMSNESGRMEIHVQAFDPEKRRPPSGRWQISRGGSLGMARWRKDGKELLYLGSDGTVMAVPVTTEPAISAGTPQPLFRVPKTLLTLSGVPGQFIDATTDNQKFLIELPIIKTPLDEFTVVLNWKSMLN